jgi:hypothetical protein
VFVNIPTEVGATEAEEIGDIPSSSDGLVGLHLHLLTIIVYFSPFIFFRTGDWFFVHVHLIFFKGDCNALRQPSWPMLEKLATLS